MTKKWFPGIPQSKEPLYLSLARVLAEDIARGRLKEGDPLPTQRDLADELKVSLGTVTRAYAEAEKRGLITAEGRRGTFVGRKRYRDSALKALMESGVGLIDFSVAYPAISADPDLGSALKKIAAKPDRDELLRYPPSEGLERHRRAGALWMETYLGHKARAEEIIITMGGQHGLFVTLSALARPGDLVLTEELTFPGVKAVAKTLGLKLMGLAMDEHGLVPEALDKACRSTKAKILYCTPDLHNPTSGVMPHKRRKQIADLARKYDLAVLEDAVDRPLLADPPPLLAELCPDNIYLLASASKTLAGGLRTGFLMGPPESYRSLVQGLQSISLTIPPLPMEVVAVWLEDGTISETLRRRKQDIEIRQGLLNQYLGAYTIKTHPSSFFAFLILPEQWPSLRFTAEAQKRGVVVAPDEVFAINGNCRPNAVRIGLTTPDDENILEHGLRVLADILAGVGGDLTPKI